MAAKTAPAPEELIKALADRLRLRLVNILLDGEICVGDLVVLLDVPQPSVSRHLALLRRIGFVAARRTGHWAFYRLQDPSGPLMASLLQYVELCGAEDARLAEERRRGRELRRSGSCCPGAGCTSREKPA